MASVGRDTQSRIFLEGAVGKTPLVPAAWDALAAAARRSMSDEAWAYLAGGAGRERTVTANELAFDAWRIVPRMLRDVDERDLAVELFGHRYAGPLITAPIGVLDLAHAEADEGVAKASAALNIPFVASNQASTPMEQVFAATPGAPHWFQLYWSSSDDLVASLVHRAEDAGAEAIVVTLDTHMLGWRPRDLDLAYLPFAHGRGIAQYTSDPVFQGLVEERVARAEPRDAVRVTPAAVRTLMDQALIYPGSTVSNLRSPYPRAAVETFLEVFSRSSLTWGDLAFLRERTSLPIVLKGIQHPDDARLAIEHGADGIIVSNHGGRQLDGAIASLDALPAVVDAVDGTIPVLFDSGVRTGSDILVALALGARAVLIGRPVAYGLAIAGAAGAEAVLRNLLAEFDLSLGLAGASRIDELSRASLQHSPAQGADTPRIQTGA